MDNQSTQVSATNKPPVTPLRITTLLLITASLCMPVMLFMAAFNDTGDPTISAIAGGLALFFTASLIAQTVVLNATAKRIPIKQMRTASLLGQALVSTLVLAVVLYFIAFLLKLTALVMIAYGLALNVVPLLTIITIVFSFVAISQAKK